MNPILPLCEHVPDVEAKVFSDGKVYLYGSYDLPGNSDYCSRDYYVFSSEDFLTFKKSGFAFTNRADCLEWAKGDLYAPDCLEKNGKYYLYFCTSGQNEGVAVSEDPMGPFKNAIPLEGANPSQIDPTVFEDDDGEVYYFWGQRKLKGARLKKNLYSLDMETYHECLLSEEEHGFHEGASICKRNGIYYMVYTDISRGRATCLSYAVSQSPLGPYRKKGVIIDNTGCDPESWNNHGSLCEIHGQWYIFYHRSTHRSFFSRRVCVEPVWFDEHGDIREVEMTINGQETEVKSTRKIEASRASRLHGNVYISSDTKNGDYHEYLTDIHNGDWAEYRYLTFNGEEKFCVETMGDFSEDIIEIHIDSPEGEVIGNITEKERADISEKSNRYICPVKKLYGKHAVYLKFKGGADRLFSLADFWFE